MFPRETRRAARNVEAEVPLYREYSDVIDRLPGALHRFVDGLAQWVFSLPAPVAPLSAMAEVGEKRGRSLGKFRQF